MAYMEFKHAFVLKTTKEFDFSEESKTNFQLAEVPQVCIQTCEPAAVGKKNPKVKQLRSRIKITQVWQNELFHIR